MVPPSLTVQTHPCPTGLHPMPQELRQPLSHSPPAHTFHPMHRFQPTASPFHNPFVTPQHTPPVPVLQPPKAQLTLTNPLTPYILCPQPCTPSTPQSLPAPQSYNTPMPTPHLKQHSSQSPSPICTPTLRSLQPTHLRSFSAALQHPNPTYPTNLSSHKAQCSPREPRHTIRPTAFHTSHTTAPNSHLLPQSPAAPQLSTALTPHSHP